MRSTLTGFAPAITGGTSVSTCASARLAPAAANAATTSVGRNDLALMVLLGVVRRLRAKDDLLAGL
jgi:hypothetical protein